VSTVPSVTHHIYIPDQQLKPGVKMSHMRWAGQYIADTFAGSKNKIRLINAGDAGDFPSLSSYDKGTGKMEGRRYNNDLKAVDEGFSLFEEGLANHKHKLWTPDSKDLTLGNHEYRIERAVNQDIHTLEGRMGYFELPYEKHGWTVHDFLKVVKLDGVMYAHYFQNAMGRPYAGENIKLTMRKLGGSFTHGHRQGMDSGMYFTADGRQVNGLWAGSFYLHDEDYLGYQGNAAHWRGIVVCHDVRQGQYDIMPVSMDYLCRKYEGKRLSQYLGRH
jgi:hypothetical protein